MLPDRALLGERVGDCVLTPVPFVVCIVVDIAAPLVFVELVTVLVLLAPTEGPNGKQVWASGNWWL